MRWRPVLALEGRSGVRALSGWEGPSALPSHPECWAWLAKRRARAGPLGSTAGAGEALRVTLARGGGEARPGGSRAWD